VIPAKNEGRLAGRERAIVRWGGECGRRPGGTSWRWRCGCASDGREARCPPLVQAVEPATRAAWPVAQAARGGMPAVPPCCCSDLRLGRRGDCRGAAAECSGLAAGREVPTAPAMAGRTATSLPAEPPEAAIAGGSRRGEPRSGERRREPARPQGGAARRAAYAAEPNLPRLRVKRAPVA